MLSTLFMLLYGDYASLHKYVLAPLLLQSADRLDVRLWLNVVSIDTIDWFLNHAPASWYIYVSDQNVPKYKAMRYMFNDNARPIRTPWITWFDDDTLITAPDSWLNRTAEFIIANPDVALFGKEQFKHHLSGMEAWIAQSSWYNGRAFQQTYGACGIRYVQGCYWWLKTAILAQLDWPDQRLNHNGGDTLLSEAIWQQQFQQAEFFYGIDGDIADRRGHVERPAGSTQPVTYKSDGQLPLMCGKMANYRAQFTRVNRPYSAVAARWLLPITPTVSKRRRAITQPRSKPSQQVVKSVGSKPRRTAVSSTTASDKSKQPQQQRRAKPSGNQVTTMYLSRPDRSAASHEKRSRPAKTANNKTLKTLLAERHVRKR